jgi:hypothetical protein
MAKLKPMMVIDAKKKKELEADPAVHVLEHDKLGDQLALRLPTKAQWRKFKSDLTSDSPDRAELANEAFLLDLAVFPERAAVQSYLEARPAAADVFARGISELVGFGGKAEKKD